MRILHVANGEAGAATASVAALKLFSQHKHEIVAKWASGIHKPELTEETTTPETVIELAGQADVIHFHGLGAEGTVGNPCTIHGIDWTELLRQRPCIFHGNQSLLTPEGAYVLPGGDRFRVQDLDKYAAHFGSYPSCAQAYGVDKMFYVPDILPVNDWLLAPLPGWLPSAKQKQICTMKIRGRCKDLQKAGLAVHYLSPDAMLATETLRARRNEYAAALDNYSDGHWNVFGLESLAQGVPCAVHISDMDAKAFELLGADMPPFVPLKYGGTDLYDVLTDLLTQPDAQLDNLAEYGRLWMHEFYNPAKLTKAWDVAYEKLGWQ